MPIASSSIWGQIKDTSYSKTRVPRIFEDEWKYGWAYQSESGGYGQSNVDGIFRGTGSNATMAAGDSGGFDSTYGRYTQFTTSTSLGNGKGDVTPNNDSWTNSTQIKILYEFQLVQTNLCLFYFGFASADKSTMVEITSDDLLTNRSGFVLRLGNNLNFKIQSNDGSANSSITNDIAVADTNVHKIYLEFDPFNSRAGYSFDNSAVSYITSQLPSSSTRMWLGFGIQTREAGVAKSFRYYNIEGMKKRRPTA